VAARTRRGTKSSPWDEKVRERIKTSMLINRLSDHVFGKVELSPTQVRSAEILLKKTTPDLSSTEHSGQIDLKRASEVTDDELASIAAGSSKGASEAESDPPVLN